MKDKKLAAFKSELEMSVEVMSDYVIQYCKWTDERVTFAALVSVAVATGIKVFGKQECRDAFVQCINSALESNHAIKKRNKPKGSK